MPDEEMETLYSQLNRVEVDTVRLRGEQDIACQLVEPAGFAQVYTDLTNQQ